ncbi:recombinase family protein [Limibaculum sp. FT325]|uniref:recombinase family protein n=1 Tax=Thermohalobaculum sediminis TaxID=2939436 RepID=UPI0020C16F53|nr:recombinase family protein [Limibaculum sediminis]MCL5778860.1 recombinase family protein [Limibaculum sediminis]
MTRTAVIRCAIYTRKSTEEGLEQGFNSLDAQREACAAYVASQRHEGWRLVREDYDDGGVSGGTLERPALRRLLADIEAGRVTMVVVYKIDRLTRSLADFARLVERFDRAGCSFVSVTQAFNTATSMGRLTLNVLLSFAQFEREVTAERIRDKIAASKKKGLWMGGLVPLGYDRHPDPKVRGLVVSEAEAEAVRTVFRLYDEHGCLRVVAGEAARLGIRSKRRLFADGRTRGGGVLSRGQVHFLLTNPIYTGRIRHKREVWPGQHEAIVDDALWQRVQAKLAEACGRPRAAARGPGVAGARITSAPLRGRLRDETGDRLTPTHTRRRGRQLRYYVSNRLVTGKAPADPSAWRLPGPQLERVVARILASHLHAAARRHTMLSEPDARSAADLAVKVDTLCDRLRSDEPGLLQALMASGQLTPGQIDLALDRHGLADALGLDPAVIADEILCIRASFDLRRRGVETRIVAGDIAGAVDDVLVRRLAEAHGWLDRIRAGQPLTRVAAEAGHSPAYLRTRLQLAFLSPRIQQAILDGRQPPDLSLERLVRTGIPLDWAEQETRFGISG